MESAVGTQLFKGTTTNSQRLPQSDKHLHGAIGMKDDYYPLFSSFNLFVIFTA